MVGVAFLAISPTSQIRILPLAQPILRLLSSTHPMGSRSSLALRLLDESSDQRGQRILAAAKTLDSRVEHVVGINPFQSKTMHGLLGKRRDKGQLGPAVAFADRMDVVQIGQKVRRLFSEGLRVQAGEISFAWLGLRRAAPTRGLYCRGGRKGFHPSRSTRSGAPRPRCTRPGIGA